MNKDEKSIVLNEIHTYTYNLEEKLALLKDHVKWGLQKGKLCAIPEIIILCQNLASALEEYDGDNFSLKDMQDYNGNAY